MAKDRSIDFLDFFISLLKIKKTLIIAAIIVFVISYGLIYYFINEEFESTAVVVPSVSNSMSGLSGVMKNLKDLPLGLGGLSGSSGVDIYLTLIYSHSNLEKVARKFDLMEDYHLTSLDKTLKKLKNMIEADFNDEKALIIGVKASSPTKAAEMVNFILDELNTRIIELNVSKSRSNREFLGKRFVEIQNNLRFAEDSLQQFQQTSGILEIKEQSKAIFTAYSELETEYIKKKMEESVMEKILAENSPVITNLKYQVNEYKIALDKAKKKGSSEGLMVALDALPRGSKNYIRLLRDVEINTAMLEFITPLYEQAKFEEQKDIPVLQIIDRGSVPEKKIYPPRVVFAAISTILVLILIILYLLLRNIYTTSNDPRILMFKKNLSFKKFQ